MQPASSDNVATAQARRPTRVRLLCEMGCIRTRRRLAVVGMVAVVIVAVVLLVKVHSAYAAGVAVDGTHGTRVCCKAMLARCQACVEGVEESEYCRRHPDALDCPDVLTRSMADMGDGGGGGGGRDSRGADGAPLEGSRHRKRRSIDANELRDRDNSRHGVMSVDTGDTTLIAFGSCSKPYLPQPAWESVLRMKPHMWLWTGDAV